jgi:cephalosporin-C deacetylase
MPFSEMPAGELETYLGRSPRPGDFDVYWEKALNELAQAEDNVSLEPSDVSIPFAECFDLYFTGVGGARIHAKYVRPTRAHKPHSAVLTFHGYTQASGDWFDKLPYAAAGCSVAALDCRGQGGRSEDRGAVRGNTQRGHIIRGLDDDPEKLLFRSIFLDCAQLARIVMNLPEVDAERVGALGSSQGGGLALACAALAPKVKRAAAVYPFLCDYQRVLEMDLDTAPYEELRTYFRLFDPRNQHEGETFAKLGYIDVQNLADRIQAEVLLTVAMKDAVCPPSTQFAAYNKIRSKKAMVRYPEFGHEPLPGVADLNFQFLSGL